jgi:hypothetical protein
MPPLNSAPNRAPARAGFGKSLVFQAFARFALLVSHQEEFAEAFADGYHFRLEEGATRVARFQR